LVLSRRLTVRGQVDGPVRGPGRARERPVTVVGTLGSKLNTTFTSVQTALK